MRKSLLVALVLAGPALAGQPGGHRADVGLLAYLQDSNRGGGKLEGRWNLAPTDPDGAMYLCLGPGIGSWYNTRKSSGVGKVIDVVLVVPWLYKTVTGGYKKEDQNFTESKTDQAFLDLGIGVGWRTWTFGAGLTLVSYETKVLKMINGDPYSGSKDGSAWGGYGQLGLSFPIGNTFFDIIGGYRQTRGFAHVTTTNAYGATNVAPVRAIAGPYANVGIRLRF